MTTKGQEKDAQEGKRSRLVVTLGVALALAVGGGLGVYHLTDQGDDDAPKGTVTVEKEEVTGEPAPTEEPTEEATEEEPAPVEEEPTTADPEPETPEPQAEVERVALADLDESVTVFDGEVFELNADGWLPVQVEGNGLVEAFEGVFVAGEAELTVTATYWETNGAAEKYVNDTADELNGEEIASGSTYTNGKGMMKAFILEEDPNTTAFAWTTDRGHALRVVGEAKYTPSFFTEYEL